MLAMDPLFSIFLAAIFGAIVLKFAEFLSTKPWASGLWRFVTIIGWIYVMLLCVGVFLIAFFQLREVLFDIPVPEVWGNFSGNSPKFKNNMENPFQYEEFRNFLIGLY